MCKFSFFYDKVWLMPNIIKINKFSNYFLTVEHQTQKDGKYLHRIAMRIQRQDAFLGRQGVKVRSHGGLQTACLRHKHQHSTEVTAVCALWTRNVQLGHQITKRQQWRNSLCRLHQCLWSKTFRIVELKEIKCIFFYWIEHYIFYVIHWRIIQW